MNHWNDEHALSYDEKWGELEFHQQIPALAKVAADYRIVEVGCGGGYLSLCLAQHAAGVEVLAIDPTEKMIALAKVRQQKADLPEYQLQFIKAGAEELAVEDASVDLTLAAFSVHHWQDSKLAMSLIFQGLKPGGRIWLCEDLNTPIDGDMQVDNSLKSFNGIKALLELSGFTGINKSLHTSSEGEFLVVEAVKPFS
ncbi:class I SAM-dependent methyltransferase [Thalassomonas actiniarum]|uniref:Class I SAM-dependent methyltransferase n=1 Tax=Thalassomonas actiniarum TaxID=485447 RepID=A0AAF0C4M6_9GAMM|nr:class I SAM-dependent methyltransferase [Thalassomonas actiniarum]WDE02457.1 class I SAM-dependent methyltransferase [Thalassomonas actiniarum]